MSRWLCLSLMLAIGLIFAAPVCPQDRDPAILGVDAFMHHPERYPGAVRVQGVVSAVSAADHTLALIDTQGCQDCGVTTCARLQLPVRWGGALPAMRDTVRVTGEVKEINGKLLFIATALEKAPPQPQESK